jgi:8-oxo-dGTP pyrophosphatase MutT (NUDIX family)
LTNISQPIRRRAAGVIVKDDKILLFHRFAHNREYFVFPGGGIEEKETPEEAVIRELQEELTIEAEIADFIGQIDNLGTDGFSPSSVYYFLINNFEGVPVLGGEEKERSGPNNQYLPEWHNMAKIADMKLLVPQEAKIIIGEYLNKKI